MTPLSVDSTLNKKSLVVAAEKKIESLTNEGNHIVTARNGTFTFDTNMRLVSDGTFRKRASNLHVQAGSSKEVFEFILHY